MYNDLVSVIIPVYNRFQLLQEALGSVINQSYKNLEIIIIDDGSTDNTSEIKNNKNIIYKKINHSGMPGFVRNVGVDLSSGYFIAFLDSDDLWKPEKIEKQINIIKKTGNRIIHTREIWLRNNKVISQKSQKHKREGYIFEDALNKCIIGPSTVMMEKALFYEAGKFREDLEIAEDYDLWLRICHNNYIDYIDEPLVVKQAGLSEQLSEKYGHIEIFRIQALKKYVETANIEKGLLIKAKKELVRKCCIYANGCRKRNKIDEAEKYEKLAELYTHNCP